MLRSLSIAALVSLSSLAFSQGLTIEGTLKDSVGNLLEMGNIVVLNMADSAMLSYGFTNSEGRFKIKLEQPVPFILRISYLGYESQDVLVTPAENEEKVVKNIVLKPEKHTLDEVEVVEEMPIMVSGDTISYKADAFTDGQERKLDEVLEKLPGFEVGEDGQVKVQGKEVEKVMVEGKDFFDGDTKMASKNIPANAVDKVQVLRNYNDIAPMQGVGSDDRIALNIKLKEGKKNILFGDISAEGGPEERYLLHPNVFYYTPKASFNIIGDINNLGEPAFTLEDYFRFSGGLKNLGRRSGSDLQIAEDNLDLSIIPDNRSRSVDSRLGALNFSYNPSNAWSLSGFFIGAGTTTMSSSETMRTYLREDQEESSETLTMDSRRESHSGMFKVSSAYTPNAALHIAYDVFSKISENKDDLDQFSDLGPTGNAINTGTRQNPFSFNQNLEIFYEWNEKNIVSLEAQHLYKKQDPSLLLQTSLLPFSGYIPLIDTSQYQLLQNKLIVTNKVDLVLNHYYIINKTNHFNVSLGGSRTDQTLNSGLEQQFNGETLQTFTEEFRNSDVNFALSDLFAAVHYKLKKEKLIVNPGLNLNLYLVSDEQNGLTNQREYLFLLPDFLARYDFKKSESMIFNYNMQAGFTDISNIASGTLVRNYNTLFEGNPRLHNSLSHNFSLRYYSFNMFNFTNIFAGMTYNRKAGDITDGVTYDGLSRIIQPINSEEVNDMASAYGGYGKRFSRWSTEVRATFSMFNTNTTIGDENRLNRSLVQNYQISFETNFKKAPNVTLSYRYINNRYSGSDVTNTFITHVPAIEVEAYFLKHFTFLADYTYNDYRNANGSAASSYDFLNASLYFQRGESPWEFMLSARNLLNTDIIRQDGFSDFIISTTQYYVLPRYLTAGVKYEL